MPQLPVHLQIRFALAALRCGRIVKAIRLLTVAETRAAELARIGLSRALIVLDDTVPQLAPALRSANFMVLPTRPGDDEYGVMEFAAQRLLVTRNPKPFADDVSAFEFGLLDLSQLPFIDDDPGYARNATAWLISRAVTTYDLAGDRSFVITLHPDGRHDYRRVA